jgi:hypothetical protein
MKAPKCRVCLQNHWPREAHDWSKEVDEQKKTDVLERVLEENKRLNALVKQLLTHVETDVKLVKPVTSVKPVKPRDRKEYMKGYMREYMRKRRGKGNQA